MVVRCQKHHLIVRKLAQKNVPVPKELRVRQQKKIADDLAANTKKEKEADEAAVKAEVAATEKKIRANIEKKKQ